MCCGSCVSRDVLWELCEDRCVVGDVWVEVGCGSCVSRDVLWELCE